MATVNRNIITPRSEGTNWKGRLQTVSEVQAKTSLARLRDRLNQAGHDTGVLTLHHRTNTSRDLSLLRKSNFQMKWFVSRQRSRDAVESLVTLFSKAGLLKPATELQIYLNKHGAGRRAEITAATLKALLNEHLSDFSAGDPAAPQANVDSHQPIPSDLVEQAGREVLEMLNQPEEGRIGLNQPIKQRLIAHSKIATSLGMKLNKKLGEGSFGAAYLVKNADGQEKVLKLYQKTIRDENNKDLKIGKYARVLQASVDREKSSEAQQRYLYSKQGRDKTLGNLARAEQFIVSYNDGSGTKLETLDPLAFRALLKRGAGAGRAADPASAQAQAFKVSMVGTLMPKAPGETLTKIDFKSDRPGLQSLARECLAAGEGMVQARIWHRDIKPDNALFDTASGKFTLIDPGLVLKQSRNRPELQTSHEYAGTIPYMHPRTLSQKNYAYEADLFAFGAMLLEKSYPEGGLRVLHVLSVQKLEISKQLKSAPPGNDKAYRTSEAPLVVDTNRLKTLIKQEINKLKSPGDNEVLKAETEADNERMAGGSGEIAGKKIQRLKDTLKDLERLERDLDDPAAAGNLVGQMFDAAARPSADWKRPDFAQQQYQTLLQHPFVAQAPRPVA